MRSLSLLLQTCCVLIAFMLLFPACCLCNEVQSKSSKHHLLRRLQPAHSTNTTTRANVGASFSSPAYDLVHQYISQHNVNILKEEVFNSQLCGRKFVFATLSCEASGNELITYADNFLWAVMLNRTVVVGERGCSKNALNSRSIQPKDWMITSEKLVSLLDRSKCPLDKQEMYNFAHKVIYISFGDNVGQTRCCNYEDATKDIRFLGPASIPSTHDIRLAVELVDPRYGDSSISKAAQQRYNIMAGLGLNFQLPASNSRDYGNTFPENIRAFTVYGHLLTMSMKYTAEIKTKLTGILKHLYSLDHLPSSSAEDSNHRYDISRVDSDDSDFTKYYDLKVTSPKNRLVLGMHSRHQTYNVTVEHQMDKCLLTCFRRNMNKIIVHEIREHGKRRPCTILLSTDRNHTIDRVEMVGKEFGCDVKYADRNRSLEMHNEHGPWGNSELASEDVYLLSHSHYFFGMKVSTYSQLIATMIASRREVSRYLNDKIISALNHNEIRNAAGGNMTVDHSHLFTFDDSCLYANIEANLEQYCEDYSDRRMAFYDCIPSNHNTYNLTKHYCE